MRVRLALDITVNTQQWLDAWELPGRAVTALSVGDEVPFYVRDEFTRRADRLITLGGAAYLIAHHVLPGETLVFTTVRTVWVAVVDAVAWRDAYGVSFADSVAHYLAQVAAASTGVQEAGGTVLPADWHEQPGGSLTVA